MKLTPEQIQQNIEEARIAATETHWKQVGKRVLIEDVETQKLIGMGEKVCPICRGVGMVKLTYIGRETKLESLREANCVCMYYREFWGKLLTTTPVHDQWVRLETLTPSKKCKLPLRRQANLIGFMRENPNMSYTFCGPSGTGKSTLCTALYHRALHNNAARRVMRDPFPESVWRITAADLCTEHHDYIMRRETLNSNGDIDPPKTPTVTVGKIKATSLNKLKVKVMPRVFLEEIDKITPSPYKLDVIWGIIDSIYANNGQTVMNTNLTPEQMAEFLRKGPDYQGPVITRRLESNGIIIDLYDNEGWKDTELKE
jgi:hypothetical protein